VLDFTDDMGSPDDFPVFFGVRGFLFDSFLKSVDQVGVVALGYVAEKTVFVDDLGSLLEDLFFAFEFLGLSGDVLVLEFLGGCQVLLESLID